MRSKAQIVCFGETLWDVFPEGSRIGGAPLNVAYHLHKLGTRPKLISRIGNDTLGSKLKQWIESTGLDSNFIQTDFNHDTSTVLATVNEGGETTYEIVKPVSWDFISWREDFRLLVEESDAVVLGSLPFRSTISKETLLRIIEHAKFVVFDVNLRYPHYSKRELIEVFHKTDLLKLNDDELKVISGWFGIDKTSESSKIEYLQKHFLIEEVLLTKGSEGAGYFSKDGNITIDAFPVEVINTVGSGDAFLATFLHKKFDNNSKLSAHKQLTEAAVLGAYVAGKDRACPKYILADIECFKKKIMA